MSKNIATIRGFLALPKTACPSARYADDDDTSPWAALRDLLRPEADRRISHFGQSVLLRADRDGWRDGVVVIDSETE